MGCYENSDSSHIKEQNLLNIARYIEIRINIWEEICYFRIGFKHAKHPSTF